MLTLLRTDSDNGHFIALVKLLDAELAILDGEDHAFYAQFNKVDKLKQVVMAYDGPTPVGCGAIKAFDNEAMEVKRMYVLPEYRNKGIASQVLAALEAWAQQLSYKKCVLETGKRQPDAIALYKKNAYQLVPNYGQYAGIENSVCFEKELFNSLTLPSIHQV